MTKLPVVDGTDNADIYGEAETPEEAVAIAEPYFADEISHATKVVDVELREGGRLSEAFLVLTIYGAGKA